jgi:hypothetical protein
MLSRRRTRAKIVAAAVVMRGCRIARHERRPADERRSDDKRA